jgi:hypothetical protein
MRRGEFKLTASTSSSNTALADWAADPARRAALVIAHPAHELRLLQWLSRVRPHVYTLTQGSRSGVNPERRRASDHLIASCGGTVSPWGYAWDRDLYGHLLEGDPSHFIRWARELENDFVRREVDLVVADAWQFYNVAHDLTHHMARLAARRAAARLGREIVLLDYPVLPESLAPGSPAATEIAEIRLSAAQVADKRALIASVPDIAGEAAELETHEGGDCHAREILRQPPALTTLLARPTETPLYEQFGEQRVQSNIYFNVIRWTHVYAICQSLMRALAANAEETATA